MASRALGVSSPSPRPSSTRASNAAGWRVAPRRAASTTHGRRARTAAVDVCRRCRPSRRRSCCRYVAPGRRRPVPSRAPASRGGPYGGGAGAGAGEHRVVDPLAGHRVDQGQGVADQQHPAVGLPRPPRGQRQVVRRARTARPRRPPAAARPAGPAAARASAAGPRAARRRSRCWPGRRRRGRTRRTPASPRARR